MPYFPRDPASGGRFPQGWCAAAGQQDPREVAFLAGGARRKPGMAANVPDGAPAVLDYFAGKGEGAATEGDAGPAAALSSFLAWSTATVSRRVTTDARVSAGKSSSSFIIR